jgi:hypothetical protein
MALKTVRLFHSKEQRALSSAERNASEAIRKLENEKGSLHHSMEVVLKTGAVEVGSFVPCDTRGGPLTVLLPEPTPAIARKVTLIKNVGGSANPITVQAIGGQVDGASALIMTGVYEAKRLYCDGQAYWSI